MSTDQEMTIGMRGTELIECSEFNKDTSFGDNERDELGLRGLIPWRVTTIEEQVEMELEHLRRKSDDLEKYIGLMSLRDRNEVLFYRLLGEHLEELAPIVYTPTVGYACREFSHVLRRARGLWLTPDDVDRVPQLLRNAARGDVRLIVVTDNERILGLGDQGAGGMGIPLGKLALYTVGGGLHPRLTLPVSIDCGTDNADLLRDPGYLGYPKPRLRGDAYDELIESFVAGVSEVFPHAVIQWEDFKQHNAIRLLDRYRHRITSFNDDIEGTAAVVLAGLLAICTARDERLTDQRMVILGAGAAGIGIARLVETVMRDEGATERQGAGRAVAMLDSHGLIVAGRDDLEEDKRPFALSPADLIAYGFDRGGSYDLEAVVRHVRPTILIGTSGAPGAFSEAAVRAMAEQCPVPIILPLSNPTAQSEATPVDLFRWTDGRAVVASGSPFPPVEFRGRTRTVGQANNVFIFPGVGLGLVASRAREVTVEMFVAAARALASCVPPESVSAGVIYPPMAELRTVSRAIAVALAREARDSGFGRRCDDEQIEAAVDAVMWTPKYSDLLAT